MKQRPPRDLFSQAPRGWHLRDVLLVTVPLLLLALYPVGAAVIDYWRMSQYYDWWSRNFETAAPFFKARMRAALRLPRTIDLDHSLSAEDGRLDSINVRVDSREWEALQADPVGNWGRGIDAEVVHGGNVRRVELRLRGDSTAHWTSEKKSMRLRMPKDELLQGRRDIVLSVKFPLDTHLAAMFARDFGILGHESEIVPVFLNDRFYGVARCYSPIDEGFLRRNRRMPGNIYRGDAATKGERFADVPQYLFHNPDIWDRVAFNDRPGAAGGGTLDGWLRDLTGTTFEDHGRFMSWMDRDELSRYLAMLLPIGNVWHNSDLHNQFWYEDPSTGLLHPIVWDINVQVLDVTLETKRLNRFWRVALRDPRIFDDALELLHERIESGELMACVERHVNEAWEGHEDAFHFDQLRDGIPRVGDRDELLATMRRNVELLEEWIGTSRAGVSIVPTAPGEWVVDVETRSRAGVELLRLAVAGGGPRPDVELLADVDLDGLPGVGDASWPLESRPDDAERGRAAFVPRERARMPSNVSAARKLEVEPVHYRWFVRTTPPADELELELVNAITGEPAVVEPWTRGEPIAASASFHPWQYRDDGPPPADVRWSDDVHLSEDVVVPAGATLLVEPGTRITLDPDVSILVKGRLAAEGRSDAPIELRNAVQGLPWGTLALQGAGANGSRVAHARFVGGGGALLERVEYKGMVCVHWARDVRFVDCELTGNMRCDDAINAVHSEVDVISCRLHDTNADAIDYDLSTGTIADCRIERAGNDGLDLMTCRPVVVGNEIADCSDKGISIGEDAAPVVFDNAITGCDIGIEVKDRSAPLVVHDEISGNRIGVLARRKNWRYGGGGWPRVVRTRVTGNETDLELDPTSRITRLESRFGEEAGPAASSGAAGSLAWLLGPAGLEASGTGVGRASGSARCEPLRVLDERSFTPDFRSPEREWDHSGAVRRIEKRDRDLLAFVRAPRGRIATAVDWELDDPAARYVLVVEASGEGLAGAGVDLVVRGGGSSTGGPPRPLRIGTAAAEFAYSCIEVRPGSYERLEIELEVAPGGRGHFTLHGWRLIELAPRG